MMTTTTSDLATTTMIIVSHVRIADGIVAVDLESASPGLDFPRWEPGSHVDVILGNGLVRQYSLTTSPLTRRLRLGVLDEKDTSRGGSSYIHHQLREGETVDISAPRNTFPFHVGDRPIILVAGGIGITPLLSMAAEAETRGATWTLLYLTRTRTSAAFIDELAAYGHRVQHHIDSEHGTLDLHAKLDDLSGFAADVYACGPPGLLDTVEEYARQHQGCHLVMERFSAGTDDRQRPDDQDFMVELADGTEIQVAAHETILDALAREGIRLLTSCQEGICGTCETPVTHGVPDHRDHVLSDEERDSGAMMMPCVSRCVGRRIGLDL